MLIKLKLVDIDSLYSTIAQINSKEDLRLPVKLSYKLLRNAKAVEDEFSSYQGSIDKMKEILRPYADDNGQLNNVPQEIVDKWNNDISSLQNEEVKVEIYPINIEEFEGLQLPMKDLAGLYPILTEE